MPTALSTQKFPTRNRMPVFLQPYYIPDLSAAEYFLFPKLKVSLTITMT
jgi:hypothetical protein